MSSESSSSSRPRRRTQRWQGRRDTSCAEAEGIMLTGSTQSISRQNETSQVLHTVGSHFWYSWRDVSHAQHTNRTRTAVGDALWSTRSLPVTAVDEVEMVKVLILGKESQNRGKGARYLSFVRATRMRNIITHKSEIAMQFTASAAVNSAATHSGNKLGCIGAVNSDSQIAPTVNFSRSQETACAWSLETVKAWSRSHHKSLRAHREL